MGNIKILQVNSGRSKRAHDMAFYTAEKTDADMIIVGEPNRSLIKNNWIVDAQGDVAIYIRNRNLRISNIKKLIGVKYNDKLF